MDLSRLEDKVDRILEDLVEIKVETAKNTSSLVEHMRRTELIEKDLKPVKTHVAVIGGIAKVVTFVGTLVGIAAGLFEAFWGK